MPLDGHSEPDARRELRAMAHNTWLNPREKAHAQEIADTGEDSSVEQWLAYYVRERDNRLAGWRQSQ